MSVIKLERKIKIQTCLICGGSLPDIENSYAYYYDTSLDIPIQTDNGFIGMRVCNGCTEHLVDMWKVVTEDDE